MRDWQPGAPVDVVVSNAVLHWVPGHEDLIARWAGWLAPGGVLAVQVPGNFRAPPTPCSRAVPVAALGGPARRRRAAAGHRAGARGVRRPRHGGRAGGDVWETTYLQRLTGPDPVLAWVRSTVLRPVLARLSDDDARGLHRRVRGGAARGLSGAGRRHHALPFRRIFVVGTRVS